MITPKLSFGQIFEKNFYTDKRIVINRGGSSSGKTGTLIRMILVWLFHGQIDNSGKTFDRWTLSVVRKYTSNLTKSVLRDWENILDETETRQFLEVNKTEKTYKFQNRTVEFIGIDDPQKARWPRREILYCNEANELTYEDFRQLAMRTNYRIFIDFNPQTQKLRLEWEPGSYQVIVEDIYIPETRDEKFARVYKKLLALPTINKNTDKAILEGIEFTDKERGDLTVDYALNGNIQNQLNYMMAILTHTADEKTLHDAGMALWKINGICEFFGLNPLKIPGMKEFTEAMKISPAKKPNS